VSNTDLCSLFSSGDSVQTAEACALPEMRYPCGYAFCRASEACVHSAGATRELGLPAYRCVSCPSGCPCNLPATECAAPTCTTEARAGFNVPVVSCP